MRERRGASYWAYLLDTHSYRPEFPYLQRLPTVHSIIYSRLTPSKIELLTQKCRVKTAPIRS